MADEMPKHIIAQRHIRHLLRQKQFSAAQILIQNSQSYSNDPSFIVEIQESAEIARDVDNEQLAQILESYIPGLEMLSDTPGEPFIEIPIPEKKFAIFEYVPLIIWTTTIICAITYNKLNKKG